MNTKRINKKLVYPATKKARHLWLNKWDDNKLRTSGSKKVKAQSSRHIKLEKEFSKLTKDIILAVYNTNYDNKASFRKIIGTMLVVNKRIPKQMLRNIDLLYDEFNKRFKPPTDINKAINNKLIDRNTIIQSGGRVFSQPNIYANISSESGEGPYLQRLTGKGDNPITGNDVSKALEEITTILNDLQYLQEDGGPVIRGFNVLLNYFNGDPYPMKSFIRYYFAPQFYSTFPPSINFSAIGKRLDNIIDLLNIYKNDKNIRRRYEVETGRKPSSTLRVGFFDKLIENMDQADQTYNRFNQYRRFKFN